MRGGRPIYFARVYIYNRQFPGSGQEAQDIFIGQLMLKAGWYLDTTVDLNGRKQKVGVYDGNSNLRLGDVSQPQTYTERRKRRSWYFRPGDYLLVDTDGSGSFENDVFQSEAYPFGPILYLGGKPYKVALASGLQVPASRAVDRSPGRSGVAATRGPGQAPHAGLGGPERELAAHPASRKPGQDHGAPGELPVIRLQPGGRQRLALTR